MQWNNYQREGLWKRMQASRLCSNVLIQKTCESINFMLLSSALHIIVEYIENVRKEEILCCTIIFTAASRSYNLNRVNEFRFNPPEVHENI